MRVISGRAKGTILHSINNLNTRPTLDRVKESLFNIIQYKILDAIVLDLFAGSGAIAIECLSRGAKKAYICDKSDQAINMIQQNLIKTKLDKQAVVIKNDYIECLKQFDSQNIKFNIIYLDPPYKQDYIIKVLAFIQKLELLQDEGIIIIETDDESKILDELENNEELKYNMYDFRKYGRAHLIFLMKGENNGNIHIIRNN